MEVEFSTSNMIIYIERDIATSFSSDSIIEDFKSSKEHKAVWYDNSYNENGLRNNFLTLKNTNCQATPNKSINKIY